MTEHAAHFTAGTVVSPGEYRNERSGRIQYFDGNTALPGGPNSGAWRQVSDHQHTEMTRVQVPHQSAEGTRPVSFAPGTVAPPGTYRNRRSGRVRYFNGFEIIPGGPNSSSWQQVSDVYRPHNAEQPEHARP